MEDVAAEGLIDWCLKKQANLCAGPVKIFRLLYRTRNSLIRDVDLFHPHFAWTLTLKSKQVQNQHLLVQFGPVLFPVV